MLGHRIDKNSVQVDYEKINTTRKAPVPNLRLCWVASLAFRITTAISWNI